MLLTKIRHGLIADNLLVIGGSGAVLLQLWELYSHMWTSLKMLYHHI